MRVTNLMLINTLKMNMSRNLKSLDQSQNMLSSGRKINKPSDDPVGIISSMRFRTDLTEIGEYLDKIGSATDFLNTTDSTLDNVTSVLQRVKELLVEGANGTNSVESRAAIASEIRELKKQIGAAANTTFGSKYIFAGTNVNDAPYDEEKGTWVGNERALYLEIGTGVTVQMNSLSGGIFYTRAQIKGNGIDLSGISKSDDEKSLAIEINGTIYNASIDLSFLNNTDHLYPSNQELLRALQDAIDNAKDENGNTLGPGKVLVGGSAATGYTLTLYADSDTKDAKASLNISGDGLKFFGFDTASTIDGTQTVGLIQLLDKIASDVEEGKQGEMDADLTSLEEKLDEVLLERASIGARVNRLTMQKSRLEDTQTNYTDLLSRNEDADMAAVIMNLKMQETVYRSALAAGARVIMPTLTDFLS